MSQARVIRDKQEWDALLARAQERYRRDMEVALRGSKEQKRALARRNGLGEGHPSFSIADQV